jgi:hypothetical protein
MNWVAGMKEVKKHPAFAPTTVAILGADSVASDTLRLLLQEAGYDTRILIESKVHPIIDDLGELLVDVHILILAPPQNLAYRKTFLEDERSVQAIARIPVLELVTDSTSSQNAGDTLPSYPVGWPCRIQDLERQIEAALLAGSLSNEPKKID